MKKIVCLFVGFLWLHTASAVAQDKIKEGEVAASIAPVHSLVSFIMEGVGAPTLLLHQTGSVHGGALKPSERRKFHEASLLFYIDPNFERFLEPLLKRPRNLRSVPLSKAPALVILPLRDGHAHGDEDHHDHHIKLEEQKDYHLWLSPTNAILMAKFIAKSLSEQYPQFKATFERNSLAFESEVLSRAEQWKAQLLEVRQTPFVVFHDGYQYLERYFELRQVGVVTLAPELPSSIPHLQQLATSIEKKKAACVFVEPMFNPEMAKRLAEQYHLKVGVLDPLGSTLAVGKRQYFALMQAQVDALENCLQPAAR